MTKSGEKATSENSWRAAKTIGPLAYFETLDARVSLTFDVRRGALTAFPEVTNLYDRRNECCRDYDIADDSNLRSLRLDSLPFVPSLGVVWKF